MNKSHINLYSLIAFITLMCLPQIMGCSSSDNTVGGVPVIPYYLAFEVISPQVVLSGHCLPVVIYQPNTNPRIDQKQALTLSCPERTGFGSVKLKRGMGSQLIDMNWALGDVTELSVNVHNELGVTVSEFQVRVITDPVNRELSGVLSPTEMVWDSTAIIQISDEVTIPAGNELTIQPGTIIELSENARVIVEGRVSCKGTRENPVVFSSDYSGLPWGEIDHRSSGSEYRYTFFTNGGGDGSRSFGHSQSQPVLRGTGCEVSFDHVYIFNNPGKAFGFSRSEVHMDSCLISRCDTGGEFELTLANFTNCYFMDIPNDDGVEFDDDNDCLYLVMPWAGGDSPTVLENCVFIEGKDDGIDHNGANVIIRNCVIDGFDNEGVATSNMNSIQILNTLVTNCEQGIEAGYGSPQVAIDHCLMINNETGLRFGDWYNNECEGSITMTNSISINNSSHNVWNYVVRYGDPRHNAIDISYSILNDEEYNSGEGCITGTPEFSLDYMLKEDSPGRNAASDSRDIGLVE
ncbi:MAG: right-handed parallel beta-helix repeat-containing protein [Calditrichaeota bacterium]|nr:right-handed parallel beta-helix repeat-containing protein [Calditrichota bacterium]